MVPPIDPPAAGPDAFDVPAGAPRDGAADNDVVVALAGVARTYRSAGGDIEALRPLDLQVRRGEFVAIMGTSGSGKSTLLGLLGLLDRPTAGTYHLLGRRVDGLTDDARAGLRGHTLGFVFQSFHLLARTSALQNVALPLLYHGVAKREREARARQALQEVGLATRVDHVPTQLSGGQQQRVALARALVGQPALLLADEPTGNLDSKTSLEVMALLQARNAAGLTTVLVTHEADVARCAARILHFRDGRLERDEQVAKGRYLDAAHALRATPGAA